MKLFKCIIFFIIQQNLVKTMTLTRHKYDKFITPKATYQITMWVLQKFSGGVNELKGMKDGNDAVIKSRAPDRPHIMRCTSSWDFYRPDMLLQAMLNNETIFFIKSTHAAVPTLLPSHSVHASRIYSWRVCFNIIISESMMLVGG